MKVRLLARDSKMPNIAIMKISTYYKRQGCDVEWYTPTLDMYDTDILYESQLFNFTEPYFFYPYNAKIIRGGTGIDIKLKLSEEIENIRELDYSLYPDCKYSMHFFSRGCLRKCSFCVVHNKEGFIHEVEPMQLNPNGKHIEILDNNFFANPNWRSAVEYLLGIGQPVNLHGVDVRIMNEEQAETLNNLKHTKQIHIAWDFPKTDLRPKLEQVTKWIKPYKLMCYVLIGYGSTHEQNIYRIKTIADFGITPFVMPYYKFDKYQKNFTRWVNKSIFKVCSFEDYIGSTKKEK